MAKLLKNLLAFSLFIGESPFVGDLERNSGAIKSINDEFRLHAPNFILHSFYETVPTNLGYTSALIVSTDSATLGYTNETSSPLDANHRGVCKFDSPSDPS